MTITITWPTVAALIYFWAYVTLLGISWPHAVKDGRRGVITALALTLFWPAMPFMFPPGRSGGA